MINTYDISGGELPCFKAAALWEFSERKKDRTSAIGEGIS
jgi:hypothetical protein